MIRVALLPLSTLAVAAALAAQVPTPALTPASRTIGSLAPNGPGGVYPIGIAQGAWNPTTPLVIATADFVSNTASVYAVNTAAATMSLVATANLVPNSNPRAVAVADLDLDGSAELVVLCNGSGPQSGSVVPATVELHQQNGTNLLTSLTATSVPPLTGNVSNTLYGGSLAVGDVTGDGLPDILVANPIAATVALFQNLTPAGGGIAFAAQVPFAMAIRPLAIALTDLTQDGTVDLVAAGSGLAGGPSGVQTMAALPGSATTFGTPSAVAPTTGPAFDIVAGDFNNDGRFELAAACTTRIDHLLIAGVTPSFVQTIPVTGAVLSLAANDVDGDGRLDIVTVDSSTCSVGVLRNVGTTPGCPGFPLIACPSFQLEPPFGTGLGGSSDGADITIADLDANGSSDFVVTESTLNVPTAVLTDTRIRAYSASLGGGSVGVTLTITNPVIVPNGVTLLGTFTGSPVNEPWVLYASTNTGPAAGLPLLGGTVYVDTVTMLPFASGSVDQVGVGFQIGALPNSASLMGVQFVGQVAFPSGVTNAVLMRIGT